MTIKKELKVQAVLDDSKIKQQIKQFKQELGQMTLGGGGRITGVGGAGAESSLNAQFERDKEMARRLQSQEKEKIRVAREVKRINAESWEGRDRQLAKEIAIKEKASEKERRVKEREDLQFQRKQQRLTERNQREAQRQDIQHQRTVEKMKEDFRKDRQRKIEENTRRFQREGGFAPMPSDFAGAMNQFPGGRRPGGFGRGMTQLRGMAGPAAAIGGGMLAAGAGVIDIQRTLTEREFRGVRDVSQGRHLEAIARQRGRGEFLPKAVGGVGGALAGAGAGALAGSFFGPVGTAIGALGGGIYGGIKGAMGLSQATGELRAEQIAPLSEAFQKARGISPARLQLARGGGLRTGTMNMLMRGGAAQGIGPEETIQQAIQARQFLGNQALMPSTTQQGIFGRPQTNLTAMQQMFQATGVGVAEQARTAETFAGAGGPGADRMTRGVTQQIDVLKKGVAAGLDVSKSGQFLRATADFMQQNAGLGRMDVGGVAERMSRMTAGFAGGGPATTMDVQRAQQLQQQIRTESTATGGFAGVGNLMNIMQAMPNASPGQLLAAQNLSADATVPDIMESLGVDRATAEKIKGGKQNALETGLGGALGQGPEAGRLGLALGGRETGQTTEQFLGRRRATAFQGPLPEGGEAIRAAAEDVRTTQEFQMQMKEASFQTKQVVEGLGLFDVGIAKVNEGTNELAEALKTTKSRLLEFAQDINLKVEGRN